MVGPKTLELVAGQDTKYMIEKFKEIRQSFYEGLNHFDAFGRGLTRRNDEATEVALKMVEEKWDQ